MIIKDWRARALRAAAKHMEAAAMEAEAKVQTEEQAQALSVLGLEVDGYNFRELLDSGSCVRCDHPGCESFEVMRAYDIVVSTQKGAWLCGIHRKAHEEQILVKRDADLEAGVILPPKPTEPTKPAEEIPF